ncbi:hypothetical protein IF2G_05530 [Cordyceps javanica]|nr:hypothetical protein IF2G_05530 [Cordyceps javanica]
MIRWKLPASVPPFVHFAGHGLTSRRGERGSCLPRSSAGRDSGVPDFIFSSSSFRGQCTD